MTYEESRRAKILVEIATEFAKITIIRRSSGDRYDMIANGRVTHERATAEEVIIVLSHYLRDRKL